MTDTKNELTPATPETAEDSAGSLERVVRRIRNLAADHTPDGWPAVKMSELTEMADALEHQAKMTRLHCLDWAEAHTHAQSVAKRIGVPPDKVDGDSYGVPGIEDLVDMIAERVNPPNVPKLSHRQTEP